MFYTLIPFINILINNLNKKMHTILILLLIFYFSVLGNVPGFNIVINYIILYFIIYLIGAYIRLYSNNFFENIKLVKISNLIFVVLDICSVIIMLYISTKTSKKMMYYFVNDSNKILAILTSITLFLRFKNMEIRHNKVINTMASSTFGVLLIHANSDIMRQWLWRDLLKNIEIFSRSDVLVIMHSIFSVIVIFVICIIIDQIRINFIEKKLLKIFGNKLDEIERKFVI